MKAKDLFTVGFSELPVRAIVRELWQLFFAVNSFKCSPFYTCITETGQQPAEVLAIKSHGPSRDDLRLI